MNRVRVAAISITFILAFFMGHQAAWADTVSATSSNWSGYIAQNGTYTGVSGTWVIPTITPSTTLASNATWVGIGGKASSDLIQAGVYEIANSDGVTYQAWYELLPNDSVPIALTVSPGDSLSVAIVETSQGIWNIVITDNTTKKQFEKTVMYNSSLSSAEWIQERPLVDQGFADLSGFTPVVFTGATAVQDGQRITLAQTNPQLINLMDTPTGTALAVPSIIGTNGTSFTVFRTSATVSSQSTTTTTIPTITLPFPLITLPTIPTIPAASVIPPFELHRTGHSITWVIRFPLRNL